MKKIKIASLFESIKIGGGVEKIQANLSIGLTDLGYDFIHILLEDKEPRNEYKGRIVTLGEKFIFGFGIKKIISLFRIARKVKKVCEKENIDILIGQGDFFFMVTGLAKLMGNKSKSVAVVHTSISIRSKHINIILRFFLSLHHKIVVISKEEYHTCIHQYGYQKDKITHIYNTIDTKDIDIKKHESILPIVNKDMFTYITIGRLTDQKDHQTCIRAFDNVHTKYKNTQLIILGEGECRLDLEKTIATLKSRKSIHLLGNINNIYPYLYQANCFVLTSKFEGLPVVLIESMCVGIPIVSLDCKTGPRELLDENGSFDPFTGIKKNQYGYLVSHGNNIINNIAEAMEMIYKSKNTDYDYASIRKKFSLEKNTRSRNDLIQSLYK